MNAVLQEAAAIKLLYFRVVSCQCCRWWAGGGGPRATVQAVLVASVPKAKVFLPKDARAPNAGGHTDRRASGQARVPWEPKRTGNPGLFEVPDEAQKACQTNERKNG